jgi:malonyl-CoA O-methyltransferase
MGCGKGRFLKRLLEDYPNIEAYGLDLSEKILEGLPAAINPLQGSLLKIPTPDGFFDFAFCIEALEHAVAFPQAIREMCRVVAPGGKLIIIGKNKEKLGALKISEWEQWLDENEIKQLLRREGFSVAVHRGTSHEHGSGDDNLFIGWVAKKESKS